MFLLLPSVALGIIVGFMGGGSLSRLAQFPFRYGWLVILAFLVQLAIFSSWFQWLVVPAYLIPILHIVSLSMLLAAVALNLGFLGMQMLGLGLFLNFLAITANGGFMPASPEVMQRAGLAEEIAIIREKGHVAKSTLITSETRLAFLGDNFSINAPLVRQKVFSAGDVFVALGAFVLAFQAMVWRRRRWDWQ